MTELERETLDWAIEQQKKVCEAGMKLVEQSGMPMLRAGEELERLARLALRVPQASKNTDVNVDMTCPCGCDEDQDEDDDLDNVTPLL